MRRGIGVLKYCPKCGLHRLVGDFLAISRRGKSQPDHYCYPCKRSFRVEWEGRNRDRLSAGRRTKRWLLRLECIAAYGGRCECCGEDRPEFLSIDHIGGGGRKDRAENGDTYPRLKKLGWPRAGFRLLCYNCNLAIGFMGYCPHERERADRIIREEVIR